MKASELRVFNLVNVFIDGSVKQGQVRTITDHLKAVVRIDSEWMAVKYRNIEGIPLTEEWLLKFGFEHYTNKSEYFNEQVFMKDVEDNGNIKTITVKILSSGYQIVTKYEVLLTNEYRWGEQLVGRVYWKDDLHVHQLQNLYFALTGEELKKEL